MYTFRVLVNSTDIKSCTVWEYNCETLKDIQKTFKKVRKIAKKYLLDDEWIERIEIDIE